ncbi:hypothetical protein QJQ45_024458 [Haematococcus lacustris]|nr:hypothetical protein QJQ45_024458 [Haematococcus lacustris]
MSCDLLIARGPVLSKVQQSPSVLEDILFMLTQLSSEEPEAWDMHKCFKKPKAAAAAAPSLILCPDHQPKAGAAAAAAAPFLVL